MKRREFISLLGGAAAWPLSARAQQPAMPVIGLLDSTSPDVHSNLLRSFRQGLSETGHVEGRNVAIEYRWAEGQDDRLPEMAADLARRQVTVIATMMAVRRTSREGGNQDDPDRLPDRGRPGLIGLVASLNRPGGNVTGVTS